MTTSKVLGRLLICLGVLLLLGSVMMTPTQSAWADEEEDGGGLAPCAGPQCDRGCLGKNQTCLGYGANGQMQCSNSSPGNNCSGCGCVTSSNNPPYCNCLP
jgi:hypothetical protein